MTDKKPTGRLLGGLLRLREFLATWLHVPRRSRERLKDLGWAVVQGAVGAVIGLIFVTAYLAYR